MTPTPRPWQGLPLHPLAEVPLSPASIIYSPDRTPLVRRPEFITATYALSVLALGAALLLSGCTPATPTAATPTPAGHVRTHHARTSQDKAKTALKRKMARQEPSTNGRRIRVGGAA